MKKEKKKMAFVILLILIIGLGIGYTALTTNLAIDGTSTMLANSWDIHFENLNIIEGSSTIGNNYEPATIYPPTDIGFNITLKNPGDYYDFTVDVKNDGTLDGMIDYFTFTASEDNSGYLPENMECSLTYLDDTEVEQYHTLKAGQKETYKIHIGYKKDITESQVQVIDEEWNPSFSIEFVQPDENAIHYIYTNSTDKDINLGEEIPSDINQYETFQEAKLYHVALKHFIREDNTVLTSYVIFEIDEALENDNPGLKEGIYSLHGGVEEADYSPNPTSTHPVYDRNKRELQKAFGRRQCQEGPHQYHCEIGEYSAGAFISGNVDAYYNVGCYVGHETAARCYN